MLDVLAAYVIAMAASLAAGAFTAPPRSLRYPDAFTVSLYLLTGFVWCIALAIMLSAMDAGVLAWQSVGLMYLLLPCVAVAIGATAQGSCEPRDEQAY